VNMSYKQERLEKIIERELGNIILSEVRDERLKFVTITKVTLTNDYSYATVHFRVLGNERQIEATSQTFEEAKGYIKTLLSKKIKMRKVPELRFKYDTSLEYGNRIEQILKNLDNQ
jgi:ribosome-binding factor A